MHLFGICTPKRPGCMSYQERCPPKKAYPNFEGFLRLGKRETLASTRGWWNKQRWPKKQKIDQSYTKTGVFFGLELKLKTIYTVHRLDATRFLLMLTWLKAFPMMLHCFEWGHASFWIHRFIGKNVSFFLRLKGTLDISSELIFGLRYFLRLFFQKF